MKSPRLDGTWRGWLFLIGICLIVFGFGLWAVIGFVTGEVLRMDLVVAPVLVALGAIALLVRAAAR